MGTDFTPLTGALGGLLIGVASIGLLLATGRIAGISGIVAGIFLPIAGDVRWRVAFVAGLRWVRGSSRGWRRRRRCST